MARKKIAERPIKSIVYAVLVHVVIVLLLIIGFSWVSDTGTHQPVAPKPIQATVVDAAKVNEQAEKLRFQAEKAAQAKREAELQRQREIKAEKERLAVLEEKRKQAETEQQARLQAEKDAQAKREAKLQRQRKAKAAQQAREAREAAAQKAREEAERKARAEAEQRRQEKLAAELADREAQLEAAIKAEERRAKAVQAGLLQQYKTSIQQKVVRNWIKPASIPADLECEVSVTQAPGGIVLNVEITRCNGDQRVRNSIITATRKADPLPPPPPGAEFLFDRQIIFTFKPQGN